MLLCVFSSGMLAPAGAPHTAADVQKEMAEAYNGIIMAVPSLQVRSFIKFESAEWAPTVCCFASSARGCSLPLAPLTPQRMGRTS